MDRYFDNAATTPVDPRVLEAMLPYLRDSFGNANSLHADGQRAQAAVDRAREQVAALVGAADPQQIFFTSGATEANNWVLRGFPNAAVSPFEHSSVYEPAIHLGATLLPNQGANLLNPSQAVDLVSVMAVNNETGTRWDVRDFATCAEVLHTDVTQAAGKLPLALEEIHFASFSAHKFYGPKGVGALYARDAGPPPLLFGGEQEQGLRGGTLNVPGIVGMGTAAAIAMEEMEENYLHVEKLRMEFLDGLQSLTDLRVNGGTDFSPYILNISFLGITGETLVIELDRAGFSVSAGAACSSRSNEPSHVLLALGLEPEWLAGSVRFSFGRQNTANSVQKLAKETAMIVKNLRTMKETGKAAT